MITPDFSLLSVVIVAQGRQGDGENFANKTLSSQYTSLTYTEGSNY